MTSRLLTLCNSYAPPEMRDVCILTVKEMLLLWPSEMLNILVPLLHRAHSSSAGGGEGTSAGSPNIGPFFPRRSLAAAGLSAAGLKSVRPPRPFLQMSYPSSAFEVSHGVDPDYDRALHRYFHHYHSMVDLMVRLAVNELNEVSEEGEPRFSLCKMLVELSAMVGYDGVPMHMQLFPKLWLDIHSTEVSAFLP
jgi:ubiquitin carboxyl-terminal hydrolase 34